MNKNESKYFNTALLMNEALLQLLEKKDFDFISIKEICQKAGVNRSTFYLHYQNINDLVEETISNLNKKFLSSFENTNIKEAIEKDKILTREKYLKPYLNFIKDNKRIFNITVNYPELFKARDTINKIYKHIVSPIFDSLDINEKERPYIFEFYLKGVINIIFKWLELDCKDDIDFIINLIERCTSNNNF